MDGLLVLAAGQLALVVVLMAYFIGVQHGQKSMRNEAQGASE